MLSRYSEVDVHGALNIILCSILKGSVYASFYLSYSVTLIISRLSTDRDWAFVLRLCLTICVENAKIKQARQTAL